mmetsp:Transcript_19180/g.31837  ORF Transcript_19180/g.31837 Transcript_19180/m.31837 type:complete len:295 (+) Transcript_19180:55-939(+)|eukprot:CAMPEP_0119012970 /NCGR_PEP_ID=MMETSP1176-20130426/7725_1 /TAXON_ID=265551 /ORGANISM="Synedropsis recta cf, Strain CCMP1620" /LENGTH=294 /DNA_ID=CAMNT_0006966011 /DNA_START=39 /DNA_END=923 /DNA_ORIENTATION=+
MALAWTPLHDRSFLDDDTASTTGGISTTLDWVEEDIEKENEEEPPYNQGDHLLHQACRDRRTHYVKRLLVSYPNSAFHRNARRRTPLHIVCYTGVHMNILRLFLASTKCRNCLSASRDIRGRTPLSELWAGAGSRVILLEDQMMKVHKLQHMDPAVKLLWEKTMLIVEVHQAMHTKDVVCCLNDSCQEIKVAEYDTANENKRMISWSCCPTACCRAAPPMEMTKLEALQDLGAPTHLLRMASRVLAEDFPETAMKTQEKSVPSQRTTVRIRNTIWRRTIHALQRFQRKKKQKKG